MLLFESLLSLAAKVSASRDQRQHVTLADVGVNGTPLTPPQADYLIHLKKSPFYIL